MLISFVTISANRFCRTLKTNEINILGKIQSHFYKWERQAWVYGCCHCIKCVYESCREAVKFIFFEKYPKRNLEDTTETTSAQKLAKLVLTRRTIVEHWKFLIIDFEHVHFGVRKLWDFLKSFRNSFFLQKISYFSRLCHKLVRRFYQHS